MGTFQELQNHVFASGSSTAWEVIKTPIGAFTSARLVVNAHIVVVCGVWPIIE